MKCLLLSNGPVSVLIFLFGLFWYSYAVRSVKITYQCCELPQ